MADAVETFEVDGLTVRLFYDEDCSSPREDDCHVGTMLCDYRGYNLGDAKPPSIDDTYPCEACEGTGESRDAWIVAHHHGFGWEVVSPEQTSEEAAEAWLAAMRLRPEHERTRLFVQPAACPKCEGEMQVTLPIHEALKRLYDCRVVLPLFVYEHGGITMRAGAADNWDSRGQFLGDGAGWDTSLVGVIVDTPDQLKGTIGLDATDEQIEAALRGEVEEYARYLENDCYGYTVTIGPDEDGEELDACWGIIGHKWATEIATEAAKGYLPELAKRREAERREPIEAAYWAARDVVTV